MTPPQRDNSEMLPLNGIGVVIGTWSAGSENRPTKTYSFGINMLVGEALSLPPGLSTECLVGWNNVQRGTDSPSLVGK